MGVVSKKLRDSARGQECTLRLHCCNENAATTVLAHLPSPVKGMGNKGDDWHAVFACSSCHHALDMRLVPGIERFIVHALRRTHKIWRDMGLIVIAGDNEKPRKPSSKIMPRRALGVGSAG
jgi:hypothetical protein